MRISLFLSFLLPCLMVCATPYLNPTLSGWHSDPSCIFVPEENNTYFCATSSFLVTPGLPIYASKDLINWKLASHALNRPAQLPYFNTTTPGDQNGGIWAPTIRYKNGTFYVITAFVFTTTKEVRGLLFKSTDPYQDASWSLPVSYIAPDFDPDLFWDDDGQVWVTSAGTRTQTIDLDTGATGPLFNIWKGTGGPWPEGPHLIKRDGYYYLVIGEGGTFTGHMVTIARSRNITGPYESYERNPILTARNTTEYFQTVGHADVFEDANGKWWAMSLATRSGPAWVNYPMGRETILTPVTWEEGEWPSIQLVRGSMDGWDLPSPSRAVKGKGPFNNDPDFYDFPPRSTLPGNLLSWRWPTPTAFAISPLGHPFTLRLEMGKTITPINGSTVDQDGISLLTRVQTDTYFRYSADFDFAPQTIEEEAGVTVFLTQIQHLDLGIVLLESGPSLRMRATGGGNYVGAPIPDVVKPIPTSWLNKKIQLVIEAKNDTHYTFSAEFGKEKEVFGALPATIVSGGKGQFTGSMVGVYTTANGGEGKTEAYISRWRYLGLGQKRDN